MNRRLSVGDLISLYSYSGTTDFHIIEFLGSGGSCVAYKVKYYENGRIPHVGVLKEYCPAFLEDGGFSRSEGRLNIAENLQDRFFAGLSEFIRVYKGINEYLISNPSASNYHPVQIGLFMGNNTAYVLSSWDYGMSYEKVTDESLLSICRTMLSVTKAVELYHNAGFLHLDIKPKNILILNDVADLIKLFDYDSLTSIDKLNSREICSIPVPETYYVPELNNFDLKNIGIETDIFEIGAMMFLRIFKKAPEPSDMAYDAKFNVDDNEYFAGVSPHAKAEFSELFKKTLPLSKRSRYKTTGELKAKLEKIISLISEEKPYLIGLPKWQPSKYCIGRRSEIREIKRRLDSEGYVFVSGIGGIGKSEIAKLYARVYAEEYHTVLFCKYTDSLKGVVAALPISGINERSYEGAQALIKEKNKLLHQADEKTLIIVDNFNVTYDDFLRDFLPSSNRSFKVIFTTRCTMAVDYYKSATFTLPKLSPEECRELFFAHLADESIEQEELVDRLIEFVDYNTLIVILMAKAVKKSGITLSEMLSRLNEQSIDGIDAVFFHEYDYSSEEVRAYNKMHAHLSAIFSTLGLSDAQKEILKNATLVSSAGIGAEDFVRYCSSSNIDIASVNALADMSWLNKDSNDVIYMHPIVSDMLSVNDKLPKKKSYYEFADYLEDFSECDSFHFSAVLNKLACAKHLYRRYKFESKARKMVVCVKLGQLYEYMYCPDEARLYLKEALKIAGELPSGAEIVYQGDSFAFRGAHRNRFVINIYSILAGIEKTFGLKSKAIEYYKKCVCEGKRPKNGFHTLVVESYISIGECYEDNNNNKEAHDAYLEALKYAKRFRLNEYISEIAGSLAEVCRKLDLSDKEKLYKRVGNSFRRFAYAVEEMPEISAVAAASQKYDFNGALTAYEGVLAQFRESYGEESPAYRDLKKNLWSFYALVEQKEQAMHLLEEGLNFIAQTYGEISPEMANHLALAANIMLMYFDFSSISRFANKAVAIWRQLKRPQLYSFVEANLALANSLIIQGRAAEAKQHIDKIDFSAYSGNNVLSDLIFGAGFVLYELSEYAAIEGMCRKLLSKSNIDEISRSQAYILMAMVNEQSGHIEQAEQYVKLSEEHIESIRRARYLNKWLVQYYRIAAKLAYRRGGYEKAINLLNDCLSLFDEDKKRSLLLNAIYLERGLYCYYEGKTEEAKKDYRLCEDILRAYNLPKEAFATLYNNIAVYYQGMEDFKRAKEYLTKICPENNGSFEPKTFFEAVVCNNLGWVEYRIGETDSAVELLNKALTAFDNIGICSTYEYFSANNNLALIYMDLGKYDNVFDLYSRIRSSYSRDVDKTGDIAAASSFGIVWSLLKSEKSKEAFDFACEDIDRFESWFGKESPVTIKAILQIGGLLREFGFIDCYEFFFLAEQLIEQSGDFRSINYARLLNYIGLYLADEKNEYGAAKAKFKEAKKLFEELGATDDPAYSVTLKNIEYVGDFVMNELIAKTAKLMLAQSQEE